VTWATVLVIVSGSAVATTVARGGNDAFESFSTGELSAVNYVYNHAQSGQTIATVSPYLPFNQRDVASVYWVSVASTGSPSLKSLRPSLIGLHPEFIILSQSQENWGEIVAGYKRGWENSLFNLLVDKGFRVVAAWPTATVLEVARPVG
jgi:hypothetical protein